MKQRKQFLNSLGLSSPHLSQHLLRLLLLLVTALGGVGSSWADSTDDLAIIKTGTWTAPTSSTSQSDAIQATSYDLDGGDSSLKYVYVNKSGTNTNGVQTKIGTSSSDRHIAIKVGERTTTVTITHKSYNTRYMAYTDGDSSYPVRGKGNVSSTQTVFVLTGSAEGKIYYIGGAETKDGNEYKGSDLYVSKIEFSVAGDDPAPKSSECEISNVTAANAASNPTKTYTSTFNEATNTYTVLIPFEDRGDVSGETDYYHFNYTLSAGASVNDANKKKSLSTTAGQKNTLTLVVTAEDGVTQKTWKLVLERDAAPIVAHTVSFDVDGKGGAVADMQESAPEAGITLPKVTPIPDHTFLGWDSNNDGTADLFAGDPYKPIADITLKAIYRAENATIGAANSQWWTNFSKFCQLNKDNSIGFTFTNNGGNDFTHENWVMIVTNNDKGHALDGTPDVGSNELYLLRPDGNAWGNGATGRTTQLWKDKGNGEYGDVTVDGGSTEAKTAFINAMKNATVDLSISYEDQYIYTIAKITSANGNYILVDKSGSIGTALDNVYVSFTTEKSYITFTGQKTNQPSVKVTTAHTGEGSTAAKIAPGIQLFPERPIANGTEVVFQATPATGYTLVNWTDAESNEVSTQTDFTKAIEANVTYTANFAASYAYTVNAVDGSGNVLKEIKTGTVVAGSNVTAYYPKYILNAGTLYEIAKNSSHPDYGVTFTPDADNYVKNITYTASSIENVVYYTEAEDLKSYTTCATGNGSAVGSNGKVARGTNNNVTTLSPGKYKIWAKGVSNAARTATFTVGSTDVFSFAFNGNYKEQTSDEFAVNTESVLKVSISGSTSDGLDCFYIVRTGDAVTYNVTQAASTGGSIKSSVNLTQPVPAGTNITFTATANEWYQVENWFDEATNPATKLADAVNTCDVTVNADMNVKVNFIRYYNVAVTTAGGGTVALKNEAKTEDVAADAKLKKGTKVTAIATPADGYHFVRWEANGVEVSSSQVEYQQKVENLVDANATLITLNAVFEEDAVAVAVPTADPASGSTIHLGDKITLTAEEGATIHYIWASIPDNYATVADMQAESDRLKSSETNTIQVSTNTVGPRYLYAYAQKGNWTSNVVCFNYTAQLIAGEATVLEVRGAKHTGEAPYYFTNSINTTNVKFERTDNDFNLDVKVSPLAADQSSAAIGGSVTGGDKDYPITINLNSTSASKIVVCVNGGGDKRSISSIEVNDAAVTGWTQTPSTFKNTKPNTTRVEISGLNIAQGSKVTIHFNGTTNVYYFEVYSTSQLNAPKIKDNGDRSATITSKTDGTTIYYKTYTEKPASIPAASDLTSTLTDGKTAKVESTSYVYAVAKKDGNYSDITEGIINVATTPSLSCRPVAVTLSHDDTNLPKTQQITTVATMNKEVVTSSYTYSYTSDKESVATVNGTGLITAVTAGSAKITITAKSGDDVVATDEVVVVVTDKDMITPEFTWNGTQFDVVVNNKFNDKTPKAYKEVTLNTEQRFVDITTGYNITYFSSNDNASVDKNGVVTGLKIGQATITAVFIAKDDYAGSYNPGIATIIASVKEGGAVPLNVEVSNNPPTIDLSTSSLTYQSKAPTLVAAQYTPLSNGEWFATYESDNWNVATVDPTTGVVTAHNVGEAHIIVAYMPNQDGPYADDFNAFVHTYTIKVVDPTRFIITQGYGDASTPENTIYPLYTVKDNNNYVTMTFGGWRGVDGVGGVVSNNKGTQYNPHLDSEGKTVYDQDYWGGKNDGGKTDAAGASPDYPYAVTTKSGGNPRTESMGNYTPAAATQFSVPCRGAYLMYEPSVDGVLTVNILQNGVLDEKDFTKPSSGRLVYIVDEFGKVVTPTDWGMASDVRNWSIGRKSQDAGKPNLEPEIYKQALSELGLPESAYNEGTHAPGNVESVIPYNYGYAVLRKGPSFYTFNVKAGKKYYVFGNGTKNGFYGFRFVKDNSFSATDITISTESGVTTVSDGSNMAMDAAITKYNNKPVVIKEYDRNFTAGIWTPLVLPYSMNDIQVKSIFGDEVEILYVDDVKGSTIKMSHHFYKTIVAGKSCLIKPSKAVMSLATTGITKDGVAYPYVTFSNAGITGYSDYTTGKDGAGYTWSPSYDPQTINAGDYYISTKDGNFTRLAAGKTAKLKGCRAFLKVVEPSLAKALTANISSFEDEEEESATGIIGVIVDEEGGMDVVMKNDKIYDLSGRAISSESMVKGNIYIHNGKKFIAQ